MSAHPLAGIKIPGRVTSAAPKPKPKGLYGTAQAQAQSDTNAAIAAIRLAQTQANQQAQARANQLLNASRADANLLRGIAGQTQASYTQGANQLANLAQGYSGDLRGVATAEAEKTLQGLNAPTQGVTGQLGALSNVLYGLGGALPSNVLLTTGLAQAGAQRELPATALGQGQQYAQGALAQGQQQSQSLQTQIQQAIAAQPQLVQSYLAQLQKAQSDARAQQADAYYRQQQLGIDRYNADTSRYNADTSRYSATHRSSNSRGPGGGLSAASLASLSKKVSDDVSGWATGDTGQISTHWVTDPNTGKVSLASSPIPGTGTEPLTYGQALARAIAEGPNTAAWAQKAKLIVDAQYPPGENGRPYTMGQYRAAAPRFAHDAFYGGHGHQPLNYTQALQLALQQGYPKAVIGPVLNRVYHRGPVTAIPVGPK